MLFLLVSLSLLGLFVGALLPAIGRVRSEAESTLSGLALGMLPALVLARLLPLTFESLGPWSLLFAAIGFGLVTLSHQAGERAEARLGSALVLPALLLHAVGDGATLAISSSGRVGSAGALLAAAAILHRVPEGLFVAANRKRADVRGALASALPLAIATVAGALSGQRLFEVLPDNALDAVLALGAGAMLRMLSHTHDAGQAPRPTVHALAAVGFLVGLGVVLAVPGPHDVLRSAQPRELSIAASLLPLFIESAPSLLLGFLLAAGLRAWPGRGRGSSAMAGVIVGVRQARGEADALAVAEQRWLRDGRTPGFVAAALAAGVGIGVESVGLTFRLLGSDIGAVRVLGGGVLAGLVGAVIGYLERQTIPKYEDHEHEHEHEHQHPRVSLLERALAVVDRCGAALCFGLLAAAVLEAALVPAALSAVEAPWDLLLAAAAALVCQMSALAAVPVAAVLLHKGASVGAVLVFLWLSPFLQLGLSSGLRRLFGARASVVFAAGAVVAALALGIVSARRLSVRAVPEVHPLVAHEHAAWEILCAVVLGGLLLSSLLRLGPRGFAARLRTGAPARVTHVHAHGATPHPAALDAS